MDTRKEYIAKLREQKNLDRIAEAKHFADMKQAAIDKQAKSDQRIAKKLSKISSATTIKEVVVPEPVIEVVTEKKAPVKKKTVVKKKAPAKKRGRPAKK
tara:strand:+ start:1020 stop:1316 length:297 start_codon:yes stop_codon:yes gene_type:complete